MLCPLSNLIITTAESRYEVYIHLSIHSSIHLDSSVSSDSDSDDYVIPPDASLGYVEPVQHDPSVPPDSSRDHKYTTTLPGAS